MATETTNTHPFYERGLPRLVGVLMSVLLGYGVFKFLEISRVLAGGVIGIVATVVIVANLFRLAHGLAIGMRDPRYDDEIGVPFNLSDMARCVLIMLVPYISLKCILSLGAFDPKAPPDTMKNSLLILWYMIPHAVYFVWDLILRYRLVRKTTQIGFSDCLKAGLWKATAKELWECAKVLKWKWRGSRPNSYAEWLKVWLGLDVIIIGALLLLLVLALGLSIGGGVLEIHLGRKWLVGLFAALSAASMFCDYVWINRRYYFPRD